MSDRLTDDRLPVRSSQLRYHLSFFAFLLSLSLALLLLVRGLWGLFWLDEAQRAMPVLALVPVLGASAVIFWREALVKWETEAKLGIGLTQQNWVHADLTRLVWGKGRQRSVLWVDQTDAQTFRRLTVSLRWHTGDHEPTMPVWPKIRSQFLGIFDLIANYSLSHLSHTGDS